MTLIEQMNTSRLPGQVEELTGTFDPTHLRLLNTNEVLAVLRNVERHLLVDKIRAVLANYLEPADLARVVVLSIETGSEYNDDTYDTVINSISLTDERGFEVSFDIDEDWTKTPIGAAYVERELDGTYLKDPKWYADNYDFPQHGTRTEQLAWTAKQIVEAENEDGEGPSYEFKEAIAEIVNFETETHIDFRKLTATPPILAYEHGEDFSSLFN